MLCYIVQDVIAQIIPGLTPLPTAFECELIKITAILRIIIMHTSGCTCIHVDMRDERRKEERSKQGQTNNKQHSTPKTVTFPKKNELPQVGLEPTTLHTLDRALYHRATYMYMFYRVICIT